MAPWCIYISCLERAARSGSGRGSVGAMNAELSRPDWLATVQSGRKQAQSRVCTPGFTQQPAIHRMRQQTNLRFRQSSGTTHRKRKTRKQRETLLKHWPLLPRVILYVGCPTLYT